MNEEWRYRCPEGHVSWQPHSNHIYCPNCDERYEKLVDWKTKEKVPR